MARRPPNFKSRSRPAKKHGWSKTTRKSRKERGYGWDWEKKRLEILERDKGLCQPCLKGGFTALAKQVDHIVPKASGGTDDDDNLQSICLACHKVKTAKEGRSARVTNS